MTVEMRGLRFPGMIAVAVPLAVAALCIFAWIDGGRAPVRDIAVAVPVPELPR